MFKPELFDLCQMAKIKMTPQRKTIVEVLFSSRDHPDVEEIYARAHSIDQNISLATVYRTMSLLEENSLVSKLEIGDGKARYEARYPNDSHHHHLIDLETGDIIEFVSPEIEVLKEKIAVQLGYKLIDHRLELYGKKIK